MKITFVFFLSVLLLACFVQGFSITASSAEPEVFADRLLSAKTHAVEYILALAVGINIRKHGKEKSDTKHDQDVLYRESGIEEIEPSADQ